MKSSQDPSSLAVRFSCMRNKTEVWGRRTWSHEDYIWSGSPTLSLESDFHLTRLYLPYVPISKKHGKEEKKRILSQPNSGQVSPLYPCSQKWLSPNLMISVIACSIITTQITRQKRQDRKEEDVRPADVWVGSPPNPPTLGSDFQVIWETVLFDHTVSPCFTLYFPI